jgi:hypothetical protein
LSATLNQSVIPQQQQQQQQERSISASVTNALDHATLAMQQLYVSSVSTSILYIDESSVS